MMTLIILYTTLKICQFPFSECQHIHMYNICAQLCENPPCSHILHAFTKIAVKSCYLHQFLIALH